MDVLKEKSEGNLRAEEVKRKRFLKTIAVKEKKDEVGEEKRIKERQKK